MKFLHAGVQAPRRAFVSVVALTIALLAGGAQAGVISWSGEFVEGEDSSQLPDGVSGSITWVIAGDILTMTMTSTTMGGEPNAGWVLTGMVFNTSYTLVAENATAEDLLEWSGSAWVASGPASVEDFWAFGDDGSYNVFGDTFDYIVSGVGDIDNGAETLGNADLFTGLGGSGNQPNGIDYGIVSDDFTALSGQPLNQTPLIQNMITLTFSGATGMPMSGITDVQPFFGTDGVALVPEPGTLGLLGAGLIGLVLRRKRVA